MDRKFVDGVMKLLETMSRELPAGEVHRLVLYPDGSGMVESEGYEQFDFETLGDLMGHYGFQCRHCGDEFLWNELSNDVCLDCRMAREVGFEEGLDER